MRLLLVCGAGLMLAGSAGRAAAQSASAPLVTLGRPQPLTAAPNSVPSIVPVSYSTPAATIQTPRPIIRGQSPDLPPITVNQPPPPPPPPPGTVAGPGGLSGPAVFPGGPTPRGGEEAYNCGLVTNDADLGGFWTRTGDRFRRCWTDVTDSVTAVGRTAFQSDHEFDSFISPVSNPVFFEDPRALTELRPTFIWQRTREDTPGFAGGDNFFFNLQGRLALTQWISIVVNKLGYNTVDGDGIFLQDGSGFSEVHVGPKVTFVRSEVSSTVMALGLNFELAVGSEEALQGSGNWSVSPYFSWAQRLFCTSWGTFNFMNTTGYSLGIDSKRTDFLYVSGHLDFDIGDQHKYYPLIEINWTRYTFNGSATTVGFEGNNLFNFGSDGVAGNDDLTLAAGFRFKWNENLQFGIAGEFSLLSGGRHMDGFRLTTDIIWRY